MMYQYLDGESWRHIYIVGDLHGCRNMLDEQLFAHHFDPKQDLLVSVGDLIDRGPDSMGCLSLLQESWFRCVRGNHEEMALNALRRGHHHQWIRNGGEWFYHLEGAKMIEAKHAISRCNEIPLILHILQNERVVVVAHADYPADKYRWGAEVDPVKVVWSRGRIEQLQKGGGEAIDGADAFYFGHTPLPAPLHAFNQHFIDTGAVFGNSLTLARIQ